MAKIGSSLENLELETLGRVYIKTRDRRYELDYLHQEKARGDSPFISIDQYKDDLSKINNNISSVRESFESFISTYTEGATPVSGNGISINNNNKTAIISVKCAPDSGIVVDNDGLKLN